MADANDVLSNLDLSAAEVKAMTGWPDEMVEDYLTIIRNLTDVAQIIDENALTIFNRIDNLEQVTTAQKRAVRSVLALANLNKLNISDLIDSISLNKTLSYQLSMPNKRASIRSQNLVNNISRSIGGSIPVMGVMLNITGNSLTNPTIVKSYNVLAVTRNDVGVYRVIMKQAKFYGDDVFANSVVSIYDDIATSASTSQFKVKVSWFSLGVFDIEVYEVTQAIGVGLDLTPYEILPSDKINISLLFNNGSELPPE